MIIYYIIFQATWPGEIELFERNNRFIGLESKNERNKIICSKNKDEEYAALLSYPYSNIKIRYPDCECIPLENFNYLKQYTASVVHINFKYDVTLNNG